MTPTNPDAVAREQFAVAVTMTKINDKPGSINILTYLDILEAASKDEAVGIVLAAAMKRNTEHQVFCHVARSISLREHLERGS